MAALLPPIFAVDGCSLGKPKGGTAAPDTGPPTVDVVEVEREDLTYTIRIPGTVEGIESAELYSKVGGFLARINVEIGDRVSKGDVLAELNVPELASEFLQKEAAVASATAKVSQADAVILQVAADVESSQAMLEEAQTLSGEKLAAVKLHKAELARLTELVEKGVLEPKKLAEIQYEVEIAEAGLQTTAARERTAQANLAAKQALVAKAASDKDARLAEVAVAEAEQAQVVTMQGYTKIVAPFNGLIIRRNVDAGAFVQSADGNSAAKPLLVLARTEIVRLRLDLPMAEVKWLDHDDTATFSEIAALPGESFDGQVTRFASALNTHSRMMQVEIELANAEQQLLPGFYGYVDLTLREFPATPAIPVSALLSDDEGQYVVVVDGDKCVRKAVTVAYQGEEVVGIETGLTGGELVVKTGGSQLADGDSVNAVNESDEAKE
jgi:RND family efflux transporter MFP subunit